MIILTPGIQVLVALPKNEKRRENIRKIPENVPTDSTIVVLAILQKKFSCLRPKFFRSLSQNIKKSFFSENKNFSSSFSLDKKKARKRKQFQNRHFSWKWSYRHWKRSFRNFAETFLPFRRNSSIQCQKPFEKINFSSNKACFPQKIT